MKVNLISDTTYLMPVCGPHTALSNIAKYLQKEGHEVEINGKSKDYDLVHIHTPGPLGFKWAIQKNIPKVISAYVTPYDVLGDLKFDKLVAGILHKYLVWFYNKADEIITPTNFTASILRQMGVNKKINVISCGVDLEIFKRDTKKAKAFRKKYNIEKDEKIVYCVGAPEPRKGIYTFFKMAKLFPETRFVWIGKFRLGFLQKDNLKIKKFLKSAPPNILLPGFVEDIVGAHSAGNVFFFPSYYENQGIVTLEAAACGNPILVRDIPLYSDGWLKHGKDAFIAKEDEFQFYLKKLLDKPNLLKKGVAKLAKEHSMSNVIKQVLNVYECVVKFK